MEKKEVLNYWNYFLVLERDLVNLKNYIAFEESNLKTHSFELSKILLLSCAEIDSICRVLCNLIKPEVNYHDENVYGGNISLYKDILMFKYPSIVEVQISAPDFKTPINPWSEWENENSPTWWKSYNKVKHYRHSCFNQANLENVINSLSALMVLNLYLYRTIENKPYSLSAYSCNYFDCEYFGKSYITRAEKDLPDF